MILFGHLGLTTGVIKTYEKMTYKDKDLEDKIPIDYRFVLLGSVLPDLIDKPIGAFLFRSTFHNSRIFAHTLLFSTLLVLIGVCILYKNKKSNILFLGISSFIHLIFDSMWLYSGILFWPYFGWKFPTRPEGNWMLSTIIKLVTDPTIFLPELIGFGIIVYFFVKLRKANKFKEFLYKGRL